VGGIGGEFKGEESEEVSGGRIIGEFKGAKSEEV